MYSKQDKNKARQRRHERIRRKVIGTAECPRLSVYRSNANIHAQIIDDAKGETLVSCSSVELKLANGSNIEAAKTVGTKLAERAKEKGIENVCFDRGGYLYHGRVQALAEAAREAGLQF
ncbi:MAG: 50S ribosomal protein L18 [Erysipelotrichaceae bacterium]|jgi:large subunit ribosomal protein L18|nr:50S ribosomal protein L18 [Erysipelotrichaceae bacterium]MBR3265737.1 50S ribosomal protein L18 [Erysipelotrichaceae bacterium]MCR5096850.1 50S ribosomal protein L18 [Erysipelotrichaceae bacterium]